MYTYTYIYILYPTNRTFQDCIRVKCEGAGVRGSKLGVFVGLRFGWNVVLTLDPKPLNCVLGLRATLFGGVRPMLMVPAWLVMTPALF